MAEPATAAGTDTPSDGSGDPADSPAQPKLDLVPPLRKPAADDEPSEAWTVVRLRAVAKERRVPGYTGMSKVQLLEALRR